MTVGGTDVCSAPGRGPGDVRLERRGLAPFQYARRGKNVNLSYYTAPEEIFDDPDLATQWARLAYGAALRAARKA